MFWVFCTTAKVVATQKNLPMTADRIPCINPRCRRTFKWEPGSGETVCVKTEAYARRALTSAWDRWCERHGLIGDESVPYAVSTAP